MSYGEDSDATFDRFGHSRIQERRQDVPRDSHNNSPTFIASLPGALTKDPAAHHGAFDARSLFVKRFSKIKAEAERHRRLGVLVMAFDEQRAPLGSAWARASKGRTRAVIIGRHSECQLIIPPEHSAVSLRHLAVLVRAAPEAGGVQIRALDLHTQIGFSDERHRPLRGVSAQGPLLFLAVGGIALVFCQTGPDLDLGEEPEAVFDALPERVFTDERFMTGVAPHRSPSVIFSGVHQNSSHTISVHSRHGPVSAGKGLCEDGEIPLGFLVVRHGRDEVHRAVGRSALSRGVLIGRYARCELGGEDPGNALSRVHLLIVQEGDQVLAVDTASTNGTFLGEEEIRYHALTEGDELGLGNALKVRWRFSN